jgi:light-independent protochlorophyllide reductase subunit B
MGLAAAAPAAAAEGGSMPPEAAPAPEEPAVAAQSGEVIWLADAERELKKIPFFVRGKARRNTEKYAADRGVFQISLDTLYEAKAHYAR